MQLIRTTSPGRLARSGALGLVAAAALGFATPAAADDRVATAWQEQAGTAPLLHAPPPPDPATICIIDTGVTPTPDLDIVARTSLVGDPLDDVRASATYPGHGTAVAHFAAGRVNGWGGAGAFPHAKIASVRIFPTDGGANWQDYIDALNRCRSIAPQTKVIVLSLGGQQIQPAEAAELENRIDFMRVVKGMNVVVAAGNGGGETDFPGRFSASFTVAANDGAGQLCALSARGSNIDLAAPGCAMQQAGWDGSLWLMDGTSFSAPIVAGVLAAIRTYRPDFGPDDAERVVLDTARQGQIPNLDASAALRAIGRGDIIDAYRPATSPGQTSAPSLTPGLMHPPGSEMVHRDRASGSIVVPKERAARARLTKLQAPKLHADRISRGRVALRATNRPKSALLEVRVGGRRLRVRTSVLRTKAERARFVRARYVTEMRASAWVRVTIKSH